MPSIKTQNFGVPVKKDGSNDKRYQGNQYTVNKDGTKRKNGVAHKKVENKTATKNHEKGKPTKKDGTDDKRFKTDRTLNKNGKAHKASKKH